MFRLCLAVLLAGACLCVPSLAEDAVLADFEGSDYGKWTATGEAFGPGPAQGTLKGQMDVSGFKGKGLVNSFFNGDGTKGTLTSPEFVIDRPFINFLIGGGKFPGETCMNLLIGGQAVRMATGPNDKPGGSERLRWESWDVAEFKGQKATIQIVDNRGDFWGHINVDQIVLGDKPMHSEYSRTFKVDHAFLNLPVKTGAPKSLLRILYGGEIVREYEIELADATPDFWASVDLTPFKGETLTLWADSLESDAGLKQITLADTLIGSENLYKEKYRPQFHFSPQRGWNNDPNGLVYYKGEYHLFFQHNPVGWNWGNMTWGHAVSKDLVHWTELGDAIHPDALGTIFSGSAAVDTDNTTGFKTGDEAPIVCVYTSAGATGRWSENQPFTQSLAYSNDRGRHWTKYSGNPVLPHINGGNRDPKAFWYAPGKCWVIVVYLEDQRMGIFNSPDLKHWTQQSELKCFHECPELFALPVDGDAKNTKWVLYGGAGDYLIGAFDGKTFTPESPSLPFQYGNCFYASQTYNNIPAEDGRRIQIGWGTIGDQTMPFNQMMDFPVELTLRTTAEGIRMCAWPVREIESVYGKKHQWSDVALASNLLKGIEGDCFDIETVLVPGDAKQVGFVIRGEAVTYDVAKEQLTCKDKSATVKLKEGRLALRMLVDRMSIEIFAQHGEVYMPMGTHFDDSNRSLEVFAKDGQARAKTLAVRELKSAWGKE